MHLQNWHQLNFLWLSICFLYSLGVEKHIIKYFGFGKLPENELLERSNVRIGLMDPQEGSGPTTTQEYQLTNYTSWFIHADVFKQNVSKPDLTRLDKL